MKKILLRLIPVFILLIIIGAFCGYRYYFRILYNDSYVNGNSAGNLYNTGLFCESNGEIFFANPADENKLYVMNSNGSNVKKLCDDVVAYINADDHYVYYVRAYGGTNSQFAFLRVNSNSLCRLRRDGRGNPAILDDAPSLYATLSGNYIYYLHYDESTGTTLYKVMLDGENKEKVNDIPYFTCSTNKQYLYYNGIKEDHNVYKFDTTADTQSLLYEGNCWMPIVENDSIIYFMDCDNNYRLAKVDLTTNEKILLTEERIDCYNVYGSYVFYQTNSTEPGFYRMRTDGSDITLIREGVHHNINVTAENVYFADYFNDTVFYTPTSSGVSLNVFIPEES